MIYNLAIPLMAFFVSTICSIILSKIYFTSFGYDGVGIIANGNALVQSLFFISSSFITVYGRNYLKYSSNRDVIFKDLKHILLVIFIISLIISVVSFFYFESNELYYSLVFFSSGIILYSQLHYIIPFSQNKTYILPLFDSFRLVLRFVIVIVMIYLFEYKTILSNAIAILISSIIIGYIYVYRYPHNNIYNKGNRFIDDIESLKNSFWVVINQFGSYLMSFMDIFFINYFYGYSIGGKYSLLLQLLLLTKSVCLVFISGFSSYAIKIHNENFDMKKIYYCYLALILLFSFSFGFLYTYRDYVFKLWLDIELSIQEKMYFNFMLFFMYLLCVTNIILPFQNALALYKKPARLTIVFAILTCSIILVSNYLYTLTYINIFVVIYVLLLIKNLTLIRYYCCEIKVNFFKNIFLLTSISIGLLFFQMILHSMFFEWFNIYTSISASFIVGFICLCFVFFILKTKLN